MSAFLALKPENYGSTTNLAQGHPEPPHVKKTSKYGGIVHSEFVRLGETANQVFYLGILRHLRN